MIVKKSRRFINFLKTTAIGGLLFLLPLIVLGALIGQLVPIVTSVKTALLGNIPVKTPSGYAFLTALSIAIVLLLCFAAGVLAKWSFGRKISSAFEKKLTLFFPRYAILKDQMADTIGGDETRPTMKPVLVTFDECSRIAFETEHAKGLVTIFLPGSPDPWAGKVVMVPEERVQALTSEFGDTAATCEQLGRGSIEMATTKLRSMQKPKSANQSATEKSDASAATKPSGNAS